MTHQDLTNLDLDPSQQACLRAMLAQEYCRGLADGRADRMSRRPSPRLLDLPRPAIVDEWEIPDLTPEEADALTAALGSS